jgi:hypothetical protein
MASICNTHLFAFMFYGKFFNGYNWHIHSVLFSYKFATKEAVFAIANYFAILNNIYYRYTNLSLKHMGA